MNNYFRITAYNPENNIGFIADSYGKFEKLWQFSSYLIQHGCKIIEVNNSDNFLNYKKLPLLTEQSDKIINRGYGRQGIYSVCQIATITRINCYNRNSRDMAYI